MCRLHFDVKELCKDLSLISVTFIYLKILTVLSQD